MRMIVASRVARANAPGLLQVMADAISDPCCYRPSTRMIKRLRWVRGIKDTRRYQLLAALKSELPVTEMPESPPVTPRPSELQAKRSWERDCRIFRHKLDRFGEWIENQRRHLRCTITREAQKKLTKNNPYI